jgi:hypothetical protein
MSRTVIQAEQEAREPVAARRSGAGHHGPGRRVAASRGDLAEGPCSRISRSRGETIVALAWRREASLDRAVTRGPDPFAAPARAHPAYDDLAEVVAEITTRGRGIPQEVPLGRRERPGRPRSPTSTAST